MIATLHGTLIHRDAEGVILECAGVGYGLRMSLSSLTRLGPEGSVAKVFVHTHLSQESLRLYGFIDATEQRAFEILITINGVGPRLAIAILSFLSPEELASAVDARDRGALVRVPGVGAKKAERLLVELQGRFEAVATPSAQTPRHALQDDLLAALSSLGFASKDAEALVKAVRDEFPDEDDLAMMVRHALRSARG